MKKSLLTVLAVTGLLIISALILNMKPIHRDGNITKSSQAIPEDVMTILTKSCGSCHMEPGSGLPLQKANFTRWEDYSQKKQAAKARAVCSEVSEAKMPPRKYAKNNPDKVPSPDDIQILCSWSESLRIAK